MGIFNNFVERRKFDTLAETCVDHNIDLSTLIAHMQQVAKQGKLSEEAFLREFVQQAQQTVGQPQQPQQPTVQPVQPQQPTQPTQPAKPQQPQQPQQPQTWQNALQQLQQLKTTMGQSSQQQGAAIDQLMKVMQSFGGAK